MCVHNSALSLSTDKKYILHGKFCKSILQKIIFIYMFLCTLQLAFQDVFKLQKYFYDCTLK